MNGLWFLVCWLLVGGTNALLCEEAHRKCLYRSGCSMALREYMVSCATLGSKPHVCPERCQHSLIALMSTNEGKHLMTCQCRDESCRQTKERVEVCRPQVLKATQNSTVVSCVVAQWICGADTLCSTAFRYYHENCQSMFQGKRCSPRCKNSLKILRRQEKAAKLFSCVCNGREEYDCHAIRKNMDRMCYHKKSHRAGGNVLSNEVIPVQNPGVRLLSSTILSVFLLATLIFCR